MKQNSYNFTDKWSPEIGKWGHTPVPNILVTHQRELGITNGELAVLLGLLMFMWSTNNPFPAVSTLASHSGMASKTIRRHIRSLEAKGLIRRKYRKAITNEYDFGPLKSRLHTIAKVITPPTQKRTPLRPQMSRHPYPELNTKEYEANNTKRKRQNYNSETTHISKLLEERFGGRNGRN